jgi:phospholipid N-methyltransferase
VATAELQQRTGQRRRNEGAQHSLVKIFNVQIAELDSAIHDQRGDKRVAARSCQYPLTSVPLKRKIIVLVGLHSRVRQSARWDVYSTSPLKKKGEVQ